MNRNIRLGPASLVASTVALILAQSAIAQEEPTALGEITVTARKRAESLQDVPFAISARTGEALHQAGATNIEDVSRNIAGLSVQNLGPGQSQVAIRGISAGKTDRDLPGVKEQVGVYMDESVISLSLFTPDLDLYDLNRVEVLRGPQGTLFGSGSLSRHGALHQQPAGPRRRLRERRAQPERHDRRRRRRRRAFHDQHGDGRQARACASSATTRACRAGSTRTSRTVR